MKGNPRVVIINADDFGMSKENVDVILDCFTNGAVSSISMFAAMPGSAYGFSQLKTSCAKGVGVHLSFSCGIPFQSQTEIPSLVNEKGEFHSFAALQTRLKDIEPAELKIEFNAQIEAIKAHTKITHLDNHRPEIYFRPELFEVVLELAVEHNLPIRLPFDDGFNKTVACHLAKIFDVDSELAFQLGSRHLRRCSDLKVCRPNFYIQPNFESVGGDKAKEIIASLPKGVTEICTHPGERPIDHQIWKDKIVRDMILEENVKLISYSDIRMFLC